MSILQTPAQTVTAVPEFELISFDTNKATIHFAALQNVTDMCREFALYEIGGVFYVSIAEQYTSADADQEPDLIDHVLDNITDAYAVLMKSVAVHQ